MMLIRKTIVTALVALTAAFGLSALLPEAVQGQGAQVDIRGKVTKLNPANEVQKAQGIEAVILIEGPKLPTTNHDKAWTKITKKTKLWKQQGANRQPASLMDLKAGAEVSAQFTGPVAESYPVQATAGELTILTPAK
jgi:hypothetical protein